MMNIPVGLAGIRTDIFIVGFKVGITDVCHFNLGGLLARSARGNEGKIGFCDEEDPCDNTTPKKTYGSGRLKDVFFGLKVDWPSKKPVLHVGLRV